MDLTYIFRLRDTVTIGAMVRVGVRGGIKTVDLSTIATTYC